ncbi:MAG: phosphomannomutase/phosphoglucomutase [Pseudomonadota bacterium]|jgi:phosphomannomutase|uniref:phosphoglucomutase/phosphomannomutase PgmG n=1 Tax=Qipengyuania pacifica TaxID=2860199 RepID=UPI0018C90DD5|nr:phosphomannomutase/phosphoglucomutase [Qipengyuania pacifica]MEC7889856.1 phosphomannomutase/phosphoglucomutase [Pseudomonadota bacterium]QPL40304.1 phosphomannomutase/phosphoglucomutase [Erythrobacter sp. A30-3]MBY8332191.1 phosphomannomutase/phosphoglucomutase [Qipengyuania pacifica]MEC7951805.1 phosphomannomutase/phosphoglucomutase [Pseudomonadota bacterium]MEE2793822.1 phosphomannomutase/phosphoglucomutase [Pseudomonadota bacterium]|tara:strand:+ start:3124 stop:4527 length:1404 start_codon:yes stop_codon:yes gene_type:complete
MSHAFDPTVLREYDIRGIIGETLGPDDARAIGRGFATMLAEAGGSKVAVGYDGRVSSPLLEHALIEGLTASGMDVVRIGMGPTPMLYYAEASADDVDGGIQITGSHNPANYNGFKMVFQGRPFFGADIQELGRRGAEGEWADGSGEVESRDVIDAYIERMIEALNGVEPGVLDSLKVGWDAGNGAAGPALEKLTARLPGEHHLLFTEVDGNFPNHHPDPTVEENLEDLRKLVADKSLDFGVAFDGDGDRIGAIDGEGRVIWGDQLLMIYAEDLLARTKGATIIADVKASRALFDHVATHGGNPVMWKTGHSLIKSKMKETGSPLAGEMSGHVFFADEYYGYDDALYAGVRLMTAAARLGRSVTQLRGAMPPMVNTPEMRFQVDESRKFAAIEEIAGRIAASDAVADTTDGVRVTTDDGWWLLRASNTQDVLVARAESESQEGLDRLVAQIDAQLEASGLQRGPQAGH